MKQEQKEKQHNNEEPEEIEEIEVPEQKTFDDEVDEILDEIDGVLEKNAQEFVGQYIQKGGQ